MSIAIDVTGLTMLGASRLLDSGEATSVALCMAYFKRADEVEDKIHAFLKQDRVAILQAAEASDSRRAESKELSLYDGIPLAIKDCILEKGSTCSCASKLLEDVISPYDATVVKRLREKGFIFIGRTNMDEFAMGSSCENSAFFATSNPWDIARVPGGSSGGSAAVVAASEAPAALGSDTGGSIRQPAAFCGIVGLKPTYGRVSRSGLVAFASSLDQIGPMTCDVPDAAAILDIIGGHDKYDSTSLSESCSGFLDAVLGVDAGDLKGCRIGLPKEYFDSEGLEDGVKVIVEDSRRKFEELGATIVDISLPHTKYAIATYYIIATAEASANLARFDGIRYGARSKSAEDLLDVYFKSRGEGFGDEVKRRILLGTYVLSSGYHDAYYLRAQKVRTLIRGDFENAFKQCDLILTPTTPAPAFKFGEKSDPLQMYLADMFTIALNLSGNCGITLPAGIDASSGMPVGIQLIGTALGEKRLLEVARIFELHRNLKEFIPEV